MPAQYANRKQSLMLLFASLRVRARKGRAFPASPSKLHSCHAHTPITTTLLLDDFNHFRLQRYNMDPVGTFPFTPKLSIRVMFQHILSIICTRYDYVQKCHFQHSGLMRQDGINAHAVSCTWNFPTLVHKK